MNETVRKNLKQFRDDAGLTSEQAARISGVKIDSLRRYESGGTGVPGDVLYKLGRAYGRSLDDFYNPDPPKADPTALPKFHAWAAPGEMDDFEEKKYREVQELIAKANADVREHRKKSQARSDKSHPAPIGDKSNKPKK